MTSIGEREAFDLPERCSKKETLHRNVRLVVGGCGYTRILIHLEHYLIGKGDDNTKCGKEFSLRWEVHSTASLPKEIAIATRNDNDIAASVTVSK